MLHTPNWCERSDVHTHWRWLDRSEQLAQGRLRVMRAHLLLLRQHPMTVLAEAELQKAILKEARE